MRLLTNAKYDDLIAQATVTEYVRRRMDTLLDEIDALKKQVEKERARADRAVDAQLAVRGFPTVTPRQGMPDIPDVLEEDPEQVAAVEARMQRGDATVFAERF